MKLFSKIFGLKPNSGETSKPSQKKPIGYDPIVSARTLEEEGSRTWLFTAEYGKRGSWIPEPNGCISYAVKDSERIVTAVEFVDRYKQLHGDTVELRAVSSSKARRTSPYWKPRTSDQFAIVDDNNVLIGTIRKEQLQFTGHKLNEPMRCAVVRPPWSEETTLFILHG